MTESSLEKCFCPMYKSCQEDGDRQVSVGHNVVEDKEVFISGDEFISRADLRCRGTRVYLGITALTGEAIEFTDESVIITAPIEAVTLQCEYFANMSK